MTQPTTPAATPDAEDDPEVALILQTNIQHGPAGLIITGELTFEQWSKTFDFYQSLRSKSQWFIGDCLRYGETKFGEKYAQAIDLTGKSGSRLQTYVSVAGKFSMERRHPTHILGFDHHAECAYIDHREADALLLRAIRERWSKMDVRAEVARINERNGKPPRGRKPGSTVAKLNASGKSPAVAEQTPLYWNGYVLSTKDRVVYQGNQALDHAEAEKAAHFNKLAHAENLMNWLEEHGFTRKEESLCAESAHVSATPTINVSSTESKPTASSGATPSDPAPAPSFSPDGFPTDIEQPCANCGLKAGEHRASDFACMNSERNPLDTKFAPLPPPATPIAGKSALMAEPVALKEGVGHVTLPAPPEPASAAYAPVAQLIASAEDMKPEVFERIKAVIERQQADLCQVMAERDAIQKEWSEEKAQMADIMAEIGAHPASHNTGEKAMMEVANIVQSLKSERDDAREQLSLAKHQLDTMLPEELAEHHISAFNEIIPKVDWAALKKLSRKRWLGVLLKPADELIDTLATPK